MSILKHRKAARFLIHYTLLGQSSNCVLPLGLYSKKWAPDGLFKSVLSEIMASDEASSLPMTAVVPWANYVYLRFTNAGQSSLSRGMIFLAVIF